MKIDVISIFPEYLAPLNLSLLGKAQGAGLVEIEIHDLRQNSTDNHNTVDDTPYGGGAGMVMLPEVWGRALDPLLLDKVDLIILTPAGKRFSQRMAEELSKANHLVFACGRYEGIDDRVRQYYSQAQFAERGIRVHELSIGDYVLGGGEVAAMVAIEAITRVMSLIRVMAIWSIQILQSHKSGEVLPFLKFCSVVTMAKLRSGAQRRRNGARRRIYNWQVTKLRSYPCGHG
jgi:tRNA (guanine37-N1)-methyltransferase